MKCSKVGFLIGVFCFFLTELSFANVFSDRINELIEIENKIINGIDPTPVPQKSDAEKINILYNMIDDYASENRTLVKEILNLAKAIDNTITEIRQADKNIQSLDTIEQNKKSLIDLETKLKTVLAENKIIIESLQISEQNKKSLIDLETKLKTVLAENKKSLDNFKQDIQSINTNQANIGISASQATKALFSSLAEKNKDLAENNIQLQKEIKDNQDKLSKIDNSIEKIVRKNKITDEKINTKYVGARYGLESNSSKLEIELIVSTFIDRFHPFNVYVSANFSPDGNSQEYGIGVGRDFPLSKNFSATLILFSNYQLKKNRENSSLGGQAIIKYRNYGGLGLFLNTEGECYAKALITW